MKNEIDVIQKPYIKSIWILNHHAHENGNRHYELGYEFAQKGYKVVVIASSYSQHSHSYISDDLCYEHEICPNMHFIYIRTKPPYKSNGISRVLNMFSYKHMVEKYTPYLVGKYCKPDYVIGSCVHPLAWEAGYSIAKKFDAGFICEIRDFWPQSLVEISGMSRYHPLVMLFACIEKRAYNRADRIVTTFRYGYKHICDEMGYSRDKVEWIPNGIRINKKNGYVELPKDLKEFLQNHWCCIYTGSFVNSEGLDFMLDVFSALKDEDIYFAIVGSGHEQPKLENKIEELELSKVRIFPRIDKSQVMEALNNAKCCLAAHQNHSVYRFGLSMNKLNDYLLSGQPVIFACDAPNVVNEAGHITVSYGNLIGFTNAIKKIKDMKEEEIAKMGERGSNVIRENYSYSQIAEKYLTVLKTVERTKKNEQK